MGKGTIVSAIGDGQYSVQINYDRRAYDRIISTIDDNIATITAKLAGLDPIADEAEYNVTRLQKTALELRKSNLVSSMPVDGTITAWCADMTDDLSGEVGLIEVPGESSEFNIQPGHEGNAAYSSTRDGQLVPTVAQGSAQAFYNLAMLPGWQKWKPTYRYGVITSIDGDTASVQLSTALSSQQNLDVNNVDTMTDVQIEYMSCNGTAFAVDDIVLIKFTDQDWDSPKIIGFKENPKPCAWEEYWDGGSITGNHTWQLWQTNTTTIPVITDEKLTLSLTETTYGYGSWSAIWWGYDEGDTRLPSGLTLKIKIDAIITGTAPDPDSAIYLWVRDDLNGKEVEIYFAYDFVWPGGSGIVDASGTTDEQIFNLADYGLENPDKLIFEMAAYSYQSTTVSYSWDYIIIC